MNLAFFRRSPAVRSSLPASLDLAGRRVTLAVNASTHARRLTLRADPAKAEVRLTLPRGVSATKAMAFIAEHEAWLAARIEKWPSPRPIAPLTRLPFGDGELLIDWMAGLPRTPRRIEDRLVLGGPSDGLAGRVDRWLKAAARDALTTDSAMFAAMLDLPPPPVRVGDPKGRWGSCSAKGGIAYSWRLIMAPVFVRRAVAAHEVAHLVHHNHSRAFHALADELCGGDAKASSRWLAANGAALHWIGRH